MLGYEFRQVADSTERLREEAALLTKAFSGTDRYTPEYLKWQYFSNPDGDVVGFDAYAGDTLAGHYVVVPLSATLFGKSAKGVLSLNTATHPDHQGRGLFVALARQTYQRARELGYEFVVGVANANSTPGFVRKLGFQLVAPLKAEVGVGHVKGYAGPHVDFSRRWTDASRKWRLKNPAGNYASAGGRLYSVTHSPLVRMQLSTDAWDTDNSLPSKPASLTGWIGLNPAYRWKGFALPVPQRMRPSPLNFIFLDLTPDARKLDAERVVMEAVNFDAY